MTPCTSPAGSGLPPDAFRAVLLPGSGSDEVYVRAAFSDALEEREIALRTPACPAADVVATTAALDAAAAVPGELLVGGVSLGAAVATAWALRRPGRVSGLLVALPAWWGPSGSAPAALNARATAVELRRDGLGPVLARLAADVPGWLATELTRAWTRRWPHLPAELDDCADHTAPSCDQLAALAVPVGIVAARDDPLHPVSVAETMHARVPRSALEVHDLRAVGADPGILGRAAVAAWERARDK